MDIIGHDHIIEYFKVLLDNQRLSHAYLFIGNEGVGKRECAKYLVKLLNCENQSGEPCNNCHACRMINAQTHPDVFEIDAADSLKVDHMRELMRKVMVKKVDARYKCFIIDSVDKMSNSVSDAFLKTLEEPPEDVIFFLVTSKLFAVSQTIRSRTQKIWFSLKKENSLELLADKLSVENPALWYALANGSPGKALSMIENNYCQLRDSVLENIPECFEVDHTDRESLKRDCHIVLEFLRDAVILHSGLEELVINKDKLSLLHEYIARVSQEDLLAAVKNTLNIIATLDSINAGLARELVNNIV